MFQASITVTIPVFNGDKYLSLAIESILSQSDQPDEILVIDNHSSDGTPSILEKYQSKIKVYRQPSTVSMGKNWNTCLQKASSDFVMMLHADDELFPDTIKLTRQAIKEHPEVDYLFGQSWYFNGERAFPTEKEEFGLLSSDEYFLRSCGCHYHYSSGSTVRRSLALQIGGYDESLYTDTDYFIRIGKKAKAVYAINQPISAYRFHESNLTLKFEKDFSKEYLIILDRLGEDTNLSAQLRTQGMQTLFRVISQQVTSLLNENKISKAGMIATELQDIRLKYGENMQDSMSINGKLVLNLCNHSQVGLLIAFLLVKTAFFSNAFSSLNPPKILFNNKVKVQSYNLEDLIALTNSYK